MFKSMKRKKKKDAKQDTAALNTSQASDLSTSQATIDEGTLKDLNLKMGTSTEITAYKAKYIGVVRVEGPSGRHIVGSAFLRVNQQKDGAVKVFLVVREKVLLVIHRKQNDVLLNVALVHITFTEKNPVNSKQFCIICEDPLRGYFCHVFQAKDKSGKTLDVIEQAVAQQRALVASQSTRLQRQQSLNPSRLGNQNQGSIMRKPMDDKNKAHTLSPNARANFQSNPNSPNPSTPGTPNLSKQSPVPSPLQRQRAGSLSSRTDLFPQQPQQQQQQQQPSQPQHQQRKGSVSNRPRTGSISMHPRHGSLSTVAFDANKPLPQEGYTFRAVYLGQENVLEIAGSKVCTYAVKRNAQRWQTLKLKKPDADGKSVSIRVRSHSVETIDRGTGDVVFGDFTKVISFTCVARRTQNYELFTYISHDERLKRTVCHIYRVGVSIGNDICSSIGKAFEILRNVDKQRGSNPFAVSDPTREPVKGHLFSLQIHRADLKAITHIGAGQFGDVYLAKQVVPKGQGEDGGNTVRRAVKMLRGAASEDDKEEFMHEVNVMCELKSLNLVGFVGVALQQKPWLCVIEYLKYGDLKSVLSTCKEKGIDLYAAEILHFSQQLASGMAFMASKRFVHMDLAARNCLVTDNNVVKVADFGLTQRLDEGHDHFVLRKRLKLALKWISIEGLDQKIFSEQSDIWSFGIVMWEMFEYGQLPYPSVEVREIQRRVREGLRCDQPENCPDSVFEVMKRCWFSNRSNRWTFEQLHSALLDELDCCEVAPKRDIGLTIANMQTAIDPLSEATSSSPTPRRSNSLSAQQRTSSLSRQSSAKPKMRSLSEQTAKPVVTLNTVNEFQDQPPQRPPKSVSMSHSHEGSRRASISLTTNLSTNDSVVDQMNRKSSLSLGNFNHDSETDAPPPRPPKTSTIEHETILEERDTPPRPPKHPAINVPSNENDNAPPPRPPKSAFSSNQQAKIEHRQRENQFLKKAEVTASKMHLSDKSEKVLSLKKGTKLAMFSRPKESEHSKIYNALNPKPLWFQTVEEKQNLEENIVDMGDISTVEHPRDMFGGIDIPGFSEEDDEEDNEDEDDDDNFDPNNLPGFEDIAELLKAKEKERQEQEKVRQAELLRLHTEKLQLEKAARDKELAIISQQQQQEQMNKEMEKEKVLEESAARSNDLVFNFSFS